MSVIGTRIDPHSRHWYENGVTQPQKCLNATAPATRQSGPSIRHSGESRNPEGWGEGNVALGLVPS